MRYKQHRFVGSHNLAAAIWDLSDESMEDIENYFFDLQIKRKDFDEVVSGMFLACEQHKMDKKTFKRIFQGFVSTYFIEGWEAKTMYDAIKEILEDGRKKGYLSSDLYAIIFKTIDEVIYENDKLNKYIGITKENVANAIKISGAEQSQSYARTVMKNQIFSPSYSEKEMKRARSLAAQSEQIKRAIFLQFSEEDLIRLLYDPSLLARDTKFKPLMEYIGKDSKSQVLEAFLTRYKVSVPDQRKLLSLWESVKSIPDNLRIRQEFISEMFNIANNGMTKLTPISAAKLMIFLQVWPAEDLVRYAIIMEHKRGVEMDKIAKKLKREIGHITTEEGKIEMNEFFVSKVLYEEMIKKQNESFEKK